MIRNIQVLSVIFAIFLSACSKDSYESCVDSVVKNAQTEVAVSVGVNNCKNKFPTQDAVIKDCSATWIGNSFQKGMPENLQNYQNIGVSDTTHSIYFPKDMKKEVIEEIMKNNLLEVKKMCPF